MRHRAFLVRFLAASALLSAFLLAKGQGFQQPTAVLPPNLDISKVKIIQRIGNQLPTDAQFRDQDGKTVSFGSVLHNRPALVLAVFYRCTGVCTLELANLVDTLSNMSVKRVGRDYDVIIVGIDPVETPELAKDKLRQVLATEPKLKGTDAGWHFLTGSLGSIHAVTNKMGFYYTYDPSRDIVNHPAGLTFITPTGVVSSYILGAKYGADAIASDLDTAAKNQLGVKSADIFFGCIHIDPLTGKTSLVIQNVLKLLAAVTVISLLLTLLTLSGRARWRNGRATGLDEWGEPTEGKR